MDEPEPHASRTRPEDRRPDADARSRVTETATRPRERATGAGRMLELPGADATIVVVPDADAVAQRAATEVGEMLAAAVAERGVAHLALTGGSTAARLYRELASAWRDAIPWSGVHLWWGDERFVPLDHPESNAGVAYTLLLRIAARSTASGTGDVSTDARAGVAEAVQVPAEQVHPFPVDEAISRAEGPERVAERYGEAIRTSLPSGPDGSPVFDVILAGVGDDGHIFSVFPGSTALEPQAPLVVAVPAPDHIGPRLSRLTLNPVALGAARRIVAMVTGTGKAEMLRDVLTGPRDPSRRPAQLALRPQAIWLLDEEAAAKLA